MKNLVALAASFALGAATATVVAAYLAKKEADDLAAAVESLADQAEQDFFRIEQIDRESVPWGRWSGALSLVSQGTPTVRRDLVICIELRPHQARALVHEDGGWNELKPGTFSVQRLGPSAVMSSITAGQPSGGTEWVEAWTLTLSKRSSESALASASRIVNNLSLAPDDDEALFVFQGHGFLQHVQECG